MKDVISVISRAEGAAAVKELSSRSTAALLADSETALYEHLKACRLRHVRRMVEVSREEKLILPHFTVFVDDTPADVYVLSVANPDSPAGLTSEQCRYCEQRKGRATYVLPCIVQHLRENVARCVALPPVQLRLADSWLATAEVLQYLPLTYSREVGVSMPCSAWILKKSNLLREVANNGMRLYPVVSRFAHAGHMPEELEIRGSGTESPLMLTVTAGRSGGRLQLLYGDFYSSDNAVNELVVSAQPAEDEPPLISLKADDGSMYHALCAELQMFPLHDWLRERFTWSLSLLSHYMSRVQPEAMTRGYDGARICVVVKSSRYCTLCGLPLCHVVGTNGAQTVNIYAAVYDSDAPLPQPGDNICAEGVLYAVPDARVVAPQATAPAPEPTPIPEPRPEQPVPLADAELLPLSPVLAVVAGGLLQAGYRWAVPFKPIFRHGLPELRMQAPDGRLLLVLVDTVVMGKRDSNGYARYEPDSYPKHLAAAPPDNQPADVLFATVALSSLPNGSYRTEVSLHGAVPPHLAFSPVVTPPRAPELSEEDAVLAFGEMMVTHDFKALLPMLREDLYYESDTAGLSFRSRLDLLRHLRACFDNWRKRGELGNLSFLLSNVEENGRLRPCIVACQSGDIISATVCDVQAGRITAIRSLAGSALDTLQPPDTSA